MEKLASSAVFDDSRTYRFVLCRLWDTTLPAIAFIGLNPSTANEKESDPTIRRIVNFAREFGAGRVYMLNLFAYVTPYPKKLILEEDFCTEKNYNFIDTYTARAEKVVFCWGNFDVRGRDQYFIKKFPDAYCLGKNANGTPKHPLYLKSDTPLIKFR